MKELLESQTRNRGEIEGVAAINGYMLYAESEELLDTMKGNLEGLIIMKESCVGLVKIISNERFMEPFLPQINEWIESTEKEVRELKFKSLLEKNKEEKMDKQEITKEKVEENGGLEMSNVNIEDLQQEFSADANDKNNEQEMDDKKDYITNRVEQLEKLRDGLREENHKIRINNIELDHKLSCKNLANSFVSRHLGYIKDIIEIYKTEVPLKVFEKINEWATEADDELLGKDKE